MPKKKVIRMSRAASGAKAARRARATHYVIRLSRPAGVVIEFDPSSSPSGSQLQQVQTALGSLASGAVTHNVRDRTLSFQLRAVRADSDGTPQHLIHAILEEHLINPVMVDGFPPPRRRR